MIRYLEPKINLFFSQKFFLNLFAVDVNNCKVMSWKIKQERENDETDEREILDLNQFCFEM